MTTLRTWLQPRRLLVLVVLAAVVFGLVRLHQDKSATTINAEFTSTTGLYVGDDVRVLGVKVGRITNIEPDGDKVKVEMTIDGSQPIPADAKAAIVSPSLVSGRFVQLAPAWTSGPEMADGAVIPVGRTAIPVSFDEVKKELTDLSTALGPGKNGKQGSLDQAIRVINANLKNGNDTQLRSSITALRNAANTLSDGGSDLFTTVHNLNDFTRNLATSDGAVRGFTRQLTQVSAVLRDNRTQLTGALQDLSDALGDTSKFIHHNKGAITASVRKFNTLSATLADRSNELAGVLHVAPTALDDLYNIVENQAITGRASLANADSIGQLLCGAILGAGGTEAECQKSLEPLLQLLGLSTIPSLPNVPGLPVKNNGTGTQSQHTPGQNTNPTNPLGNVPGLNGLGHTLHHTTDGLKHGVHGLTNGLGNALHRGNGS